jgi:hypothetical protein
MKRHLYVLAASALAAAAPAQMSGSFLIDPTGGPGVFHSFTEAVNALFVNGVNGPVEILVVPGTYTESILVPPIQGASSANPIRFKSLVGPGSVSINGAAGDTFAFLGVAFLRNSSFAFDALDFIGAPGHAISATMFVEDIEIAHCTFGDGHRSNVSGEWRHALIVSENNFDEAGWRVHHNKFKLASHTNRSSFGIYLSNGGDWEIHDNEFDLNGADYGMWLINSNNRVDRIYNNLFHGSLHASTSSYANDVCAIRADLSNYENEITHNTFAVTIPTIGCCVATGGYFNGVQNVQNYVFGNVFVVLGAGTALCVNGWSGNIDPFVADGNTYHVLGGEVGRLDPSMPGYTTLAAFQVASGQDANSQQVDPQLLSPFAAPIDLRPAVGSPVRDAARNTPSYVVADYAGRLRDAAPDAGAYETTSFALFGRSCAGTGGLVPAMSSSGTVALGSTNFAFELTQARATTLALLFGGLSRTQAGAVPLPFAIGGGCSILVSPDAVRSTLTSAAGAATLPQAIPASTAFAGVDLYFQWAVLDPQSGSSFGIAVSEGGALQL